MAKHKLFTPDKGWKLEILPAPYNGMKSKTTDTDMFSEFHPVGRTYTGIHAYVTKALLEYSKGENSSIALLRIGAGAYATECELETGETALFQLYANGQCKGAVRTLDGRHLPIDTIGAKTYDFDLTSIFMALLGQLREVSTTAANVITGTQATGQVEEKDIYYISDAIYFGLENKALKATMPGGNIDLLTDQMVKSVVMEGTEVCGKSKFFNKGLGSTTLNSQLRFADAMKEFQGWRAQQQLWTEEEEQLIPTFPDDYPVLPETVKICRRYVGTHEDRQPMVNFMWVRLVPLQV